MNFLKGLEPTRAPGSATGKRKLNSWSQPMITLFQEIKVEKDLYFYFVAKNFL